MRPEDLSLLFTLAALVALVTWVGVELLLWLLKASVRVGGDVWLWGMCCIGTLVWMNHISW